MFVVVDKFNTKRVGNWKQIVNRGKENFAPI